MAERERFELSTPFRVRTLSRRVPSTTQPPLQPGAKANRLGLGMAMGFWAWRDLSGSCSGGDEEGVVFLALSEQEEFAE